MIGLIDLISILQALFTDFYNSVVLLFIVLGLESKIGKLITYSPQITYDITGLANCTIFSYNNLQLDQNTLQTYLMVSQDCYNPNSLCYTFVPVEGTINIPFDIIRNYVLPSDTYLYEYYNFVNFDGTSTKCTRSITTVNNSTTIKNSIALSYINGTMINLIDNDDEINTVNMPNMTLSFAHTYKYFIAQYNNMKKTTNNNIGLKIPSIYAVQNTTDSLIFNSTFINICIDSFRLNSIYQSANYSYLCVPVSIEDTTDYFLRLSSYTFIASIVLSGVCCVPDCIKTILQYKFKSD